MRIKTILWVLVLVTVLGLGGLSCGGGGGGGGGSYVGTWSCQGCGNEWPSTVILSSDGTAAGYFPAYGWLSGTWTSSGSLIIGASGNETMTAQVSWVDANTIMVTYAAWGAATYIRQ